MKLKHISKDMTGAINALLLPLIAIVLLFMAAGVFGVWAFMERQDYKNNVDQKVAVAVDQAKDEEAAAKEEEFAEREKSPLKTYIGPDAYGGVNLKYPKTWSGYVVDSPDGEPSIDAYFSPGTVPDVTNENSVHALRVQVVSEKYATELENFQGQVEEGTVRVQPYAFPKLPKNVGTRIEGQITETKTGVMILMPLRDKTLKIFTEADQYRGDLDNIILPNFTFAP